MSVKHQPHRTPYKFRSRKHQSFKYRTVSNDQLRKILEVSEKDPSLRDLHDVVTIVSSTGLRAGELRELRWSDVDFQNRRLIIHSCKSGPPRYVPFGDKTAVTLAARRNAGPDADFVLGRSPAGVLRRVACKLRSQFTEPGKPVVSLRILRHTFFTRLMASGADILSIATIGGWRLDRLGRKFVPTRDRLDQVAARDQERLEAQE